ncbi:MAG: hypothetical protein HW405_285 [Candidatus Berkelbacteria bacterium]|nr:hypothetical protein [Candidatus Berkelbacteria bacterium]
MHLSLQYITPHVIIKRPLEEGDDHEGFQEGRIHNAAVFSILQIW